MLKVTNDGSYQQQHQRSLMYLARLVTITVTNFDSIVIRSDDDFQRWWLLLTVVNGDDYHQRQFSLTILTMNSYNCRWLPKFEEKIITGVRVTSDVPLILRWHIPCSEETTCRRLDQRCRHVYRSAIAQETETDGNKAWQIDDRQIWRIFFARVNTCLYIFVVIEKSFLCLYIFSRMTHLNKWKAKNHFRFLIKSVYFSLQYMIYVIMRERLM